MWLLTFIFTFAILITFNLGAEFQSSIWGYECENSKCVKIEIKELKTKAVSQQVCNMFCGKDAGALWPKPTGNVKLENILARINPKLIEFKITKLRSNERFWIENEKRLKEQIDVKIPRNWKLTDEGKPLIIDIITDNDNTVLEMETDESYNLRGLEQDGNIYVLIKSDTIYGARHALETLSQLILFDDIRREIQIVAEFDITDSPAFKHRGLLLDTARNYFSVESIKRTIDAMAMVKLNTFHWHITDSQSFPFVMESLPELSKYGAYSPDQVYTHEDITDILKYAHVRGVRVIPEFDAPAHVGEGWQKTNLTTCFNYQPWQKYCVEPPCGQLDPSKSELYNVLEKIYKEMMDVFRYPDVFHMGGDEVSVGCWNASHELQQWMTGEKEWGLEEVDFMRLWGHFQENALARLDKILPKSVPIILWTSRLTDVPYIDMFLNKERYIIQIWTTGDDTKILDLLQRGYKLIISNYDALYFDCGFGAWVTEGNNWCAPYIGWEKVYSNSLDKIGGKYKSQILGAEAALWSEQSDEHVLDNRMWPRASALAERLWTNPTSSWREAESRMLIHHRRLIENGIAPERLQPEWCSQHNGECPI